MFRRAALVSAVVATFAAGALVSSPASAGSNVAWSVSVGVPGVGVSVGAPGYWGPAYRPYYPYRVYAPAPVVYPAPYVYPAPVYRPARIYRPYPVAVAPPRVVAYGGYGPY